MSQPRRMDAYIRVSRVGGREGESYISPAIQREAIERWAAYRKVEIAAWHIDEDQSGGTQQRPGLVEAMRRVEAGETDGIACWKINRFARNVAGAITDVERIQAAGGSLAFVTEDIDPTGPMGELVLTIMLAIAKLERDNITEAWSVAQQRAIARGAKVSPTTYGYRRRDDGMLEPHPVEGGHVQRAYDLAAAQGVAAAHRYLAEHAPERQWTGSTTRAMLARRTYLGESRTGQHVNPAAHEPLVSRAIWEAAQHDPRAYTRATEAYPLSGFARCATCEAPMVAGSKSRRGERTYRCSGAQTLYNGVRCPKPAMIIAERLETYVREEVRPILAGASVRAVEGGDEATLAERAVVEAEAELDAFAADLTLRRALGGSYHEHLASRVKAAEEARDAFRAIAARSLTRELMGAEDILDGGDVRLFAELLRHMLASILVAPGRAALSERIRFVPLQP